MRRGRRLSREDERLWASVARQAVPLKGRRYPTVPSVEDGSAPAGEPAEVHAGAAAQGRPPAAGKPPAGESLRRFDPLPLDDLAAAFGVTDEPIRAPLSPLPALPPKMRPQTQHPIERPTRRKIVRGRIAIEARLDLHEMTQSVAHHQLIGFLRQAQAMGLRHILVITGRGGATAGGGDFGSRGILRRVVPLWFSGPEFRPLVSGFESAGRHHGGDGAFYVRVRRRT